MKRLLLLSLSCYIYSFSIAQSLQPSVVASSGRSFNSGVSQLDWTLGETATNTLAAGSMLTQGFHQPNLLITSVSETQSNYSVNVFPNPTADRVQLQFKNPAGNISVELFSVDGKLLQSFKASNNAELNITEYNAGTYLLILKDENIKAATYRIVKSH